MALVIGVRFRTGQKTYYFDPGDTQYKEGENVILETSRGVEYGTVVFGNKEVDDKEVIPPLKPILRKADEKDEEQNTKNLAERERLISVSQQKVAAHNLAMKIVDAEYTFDRSKLIIYFTADNRIDFRELVKDLASVFHLRIELRQIYERDDIKLRGALASCGRPCCCITHLQDYDKVSIKMAKLQGLSLSPNKISGCCGKLMCCLRYEYPYYQEMYKKMPKLNSTVTTPDGDGTVASNDILRQEVKVKITDTDGSYDYRIYPLEKISARQVQSEGDLNGNDD
ncbi:MAG: stage 0 sporulation family protein [Clostridia bacterium]